MLWLIVVEWLARLILALLVFLSFWSITIMVDRKRYFKNLTLNGSTLKLAIRKGNYLPNQNHGVFEEMMQELTLLTSSSSVDKAFEAYASERRKEMEKGLPILGTLGSTTPFLGLLGTILGIIVSFGELSRGTGSTNSVMFSLAEALILTAVGLMVAIPAVVGFNHFNRKAKDILAEAASIKDLYLAYRK
jgi:biopolymer transport protein ExbB/TolQ